MSISDYLLKPNSVGVMGCTFDLPKSSVVRLFEETEKFDASEGRHPEDYFLYTMLTDKYGYGPDRYLPVDDVWKVLTHLGIYEPRKPPLGPWEPKIPYGKGIAGSKIRTESFDVSLTDITYAVGDYLERDQADLEHQNALHIDSQWTEGVLRLDLFSVTDDGIERQIDFLKSLPFVSEGKQNGSPRRYSSRFAFKTYPGAVAVWAFNRLENPVHEEILRYLLGAVHYFEAKEWRISSVLSAIAVESVLADIYEELMHEQSPPDTLGELLHQLIAPARMPDKVVEQAKTVNTNRILSVHRSTSEAGETEALTSLVDGTRFTYWAYHDGPLGMH